MRQASKLPVRAAPNSGRCCSIKPSMKADAGTACNYTFNPDFAVSHRVLDGKRPFRSESNKLQPPSGLSSVGFREFRMDVIDYSDKDRVRICATPEVEIPTAAPPLPTQDHYLPPIPSLSALSPPAASPVGSRFVARSATQRSSCKPPKPLAPRSRMVFLSAAAGPYHHPLSSALARQNLHSSRFSHLSIPSHSGGRG